MTKKVVAIITRLPALFASTLTRLINRTPASRQESRECHKRLFHSTQLSA